jgi:Spy/CpxP family protein refolding chaperone
MQHVSYKMVGMALVLIAALVGGVQAQQQHEQHHPGGVQTAQPQPAETATGMPAQPQPMQGMMENMQGMMQHMQGMMARMQGMMGRRGMGTMTQEDEDEDASPHRGLMGRRGMMGPSGMMGRHLERLAQQLELTDAQQAQVRALLRNHAKEAMRLRTDIGVLAIDVQQLLETDPVDLPKAKQLFQSIGTKEADLRLAHVTLMQEVTKLLTPEQQKTFRTMRERMMGMDGMMSMGGMMERGHGER